MSEPVTDNKTKNLLKAGGVFIICLLAFLVILFNIYGHYRNQRMQRARDTGESVESRLIEYIDTGMYCADMLNVICTEYGVREKDKIDEACEKFMESDNSIINMVMIFNGDSLEYIYPSNARGVIVPDLITEGNALSHEANYSRVSGSKIISDSFNLLSGEKVFAIVQYFRENPGHAPSEFERMGHVVIIIDQEQLMEKSGVYDLSSQGYNYRFYRINPATGIVRDLAVFGERFLNQPVIADKTMPNGETWHLLLSLNGGWVNAAEIAAGLAVAIIVSLLTSIIFYLFFSLK